MDSLIEKDYLTNITAFPGKYFVKTEYIAPEKIYGFVNLYQPDEGKLIKKGMPTKEHPLFY
ncbi:MAG: hypothetical protein ACLFM7_07340 [Bacteroidales bacterium]